MRFSLKRNSNDYGSITEPCGTYRVLQISTHYGEKCTYKSEPMVCTRLQRLSYESLKHRKTFPIEITFSYCRFNENFPRDLCFFWKPFQTISFISSFFREDFLITYVVILF